jgi:hypothetical protein
MSERNKTHNGRDRSGNFKVKREDVEERLTEPDGPDVIRDDVRLGGAVEDVGTAGAERGARIEQLVEDNRANVDRVTGRDREGAGDR